MVSKMNNKWLGNPRTTTSRRKVNTGEIEKKTVNSGQYVPPATDKGSARTSLRLIIVTLGFLPQNYGISFACFKETLM